MPIHPTAVIDSKAEIDPTVEIGPYVVIEGPVMIRANCLIKSHAFLTGHTEIGERTEIHPFAIVGNTPQDFHHTGERSYCKIGKGVIIREGATVHLGTQPESSTVIGDDCLLMAYSHVGHNCQLGKGVKVYNLALLAGHVEAEDGVIFSASTLIHQFVRCGKLAFIAADARVSTDIPPFMLAFGESTIVQYNRIGMQRAGYQSADINEIRQAFRVLYRSGLTRRNAIAQLAEMIQTNAGKELLKFISVDSKRGYCIGSKGHRNRGGDDENEKGHHLQ